MDMLFIADKSGGLEGLSFISEFASGRMAITARRRSQGELNACVEKRGFPC
jgi:hypothetical protein